MKSQILTAAVRQSERLCAQEQSPDQTVANEKQQVRIKILLS